MSKLEILEQRALSLSLFGTVLMAASGIGLGLYLNIESILLDGFFSLLSMGMTGLSLFTAYLIHRPEDRRFQFGYAHLEPLVSTINGLVILAVCSYSFANGVSGLIGGGHPISFDLALYYAVPITLFCSSLYLYETWVGRQLNSELVRVDSKEWLVDAILSFTLTLGFILGKYMEGTSWAPYVIYVDPALVSLLSVCAMVIPISVLRRNLSEVLLVAPPEVDTHIRKRVMEVLLPYKVRTIGTHVAKMGRHFDIEVNVYVDEASPLFQASVESFDRVRQQLSDALDLDPNDHWISISFTHNQQWL